MATGNKNYNIADKTTLDAINNTKLGNATDTGGSTTSGTVMGKLNNIISTITGRLGATNDTGGSATAGTLMAKVNNLITRVTALENNAGGGSIKSVQIGTTTFTTTNNASGQPVPQNTTITINAVDPTKTIVLLHSSISVATTDKTTDNSDAYSYYKTYTSYLVSLNSTSMVISPNWAMQAKSDSYSSDRRIYTEIGTTSYQVIEFY